VDDQDLDWLGDLRWKGYPHLQPVRDVVSAPPAEPPPSSDKAAPDARLGALAAENEALRARIEALGRLSGDFERRLAESGTAYEGAVLEAESRLRDAALERQRMAGELEAAKAEGARLTARDAAREADLRLERERRADLEKSLLAERRKREEASLEAERLRAESAGHAGALAELRRQAGAQNERLVQAKALTDEDVRVLRLEMREFLAKLHRLQDSAGERT
jgi:hypothetical protein